MNGETTNKMPDLIETLKKINAFVFDVDGVLTDGSVVVTEEGDLLRNMNIKDGYALKKAITKGYKIAIITGGRSQGVVKRLNGLGITDIYIGAEEKGEAFKDFCTLHNLSPLEIAMMGDDNPDLILLEQCGLSTCPKDAVPDVIERCQYISPIHGGRGAVRDLLEKVMKAQGKW